MIKMSLKKAIEHQKEHRKPYRGAKADDKTCRNHGSCSYCTCNRLSNTKRRLEKSEYSKTEYKEESYRMG